MQFFSFFQFNGTVGLVIASVISLTAGSNGNTVLFVLLTAVAVLGVAVFFFLSCVCASLLPATPPRPSPSLPLPLRDVQPRASTRGRRW